jgi:hypothetical protein
LSGKSRQAATCRRQRQKPNHVGSANDRVAAIASRRVDYNRAAAVIRHERGASVSQKGGEDKIQMYRERYLLEK